MTKTREDAEAAAAKVITDNAYNTELPLWTAASAAKTAADDDYNTKDTAW